MPARTKKVDKSQDVLDLFSTPDASWAAVLSKDMTPSAYQQEVFRHVLESTTQNLMVRAVAGAGKTWVIEKSAKILCLTPRDEFRISLASFNVHIRQVLAERLNDFKGVSVSTIHAIGYQCLKRAYGTLIKRAEPDKYTRLTRQHLARWLDEHQADDDPMYHPDANQRRLLISLIEDVLSMARLNLCDFRDNQALEALLQHHALLLPVDYFPVLRRIMHAALDELTEYGIHDFTDMVYMPVILNMAPLTADYVFVDECQDLSPAQLELILKTCKTGGRMVFVGDPCQPPGTLVLMAKQSPDSAPSKHIEDLKIGDWIQSHDPEQPRVRSVSQVTGITERPFVGTLIKVQMHNGWGSRYTPNHRCIASFAPFDEHWCTYLSRKGSTYSLGMIQLKIPKHPKPNTLVSRMLSEEADAIWILAFHEYEREAALERQTLTKMLSPARSVGPIMLSEKDASAILKQFRREMEHPFFEAQAKQFHSLAGARITHACNLIDGSLMLTYENNPTRPLPQTDWISVAVTHVDYDGPVYSINVETDHTYIADGILTHNCQAIMGFAGASVNSFDNIRARVNAKVLPLSICYRCPKSHIRVAKRYVPEIEAHPDAIEGIIECQPEQTLQDLLQPGDLVICRTTGPLISWCIRLIQNKIGARIRGVEIGEELCRTVKQISSMPGFTYGAFLTFVDRHLNQQAEYYLNHQNGEALLTVLMDKTGAIRACHEAYHAETANVGELCQAINALFSDQEATIWFSTVHRAKGLENQNVFILEPHKMPLVWEGQQPWELQQEYNLLYIAVTRAKEKMVILQPRGVAPGTYMQRYQPAD